MLCVIARIDGTARTRLEALGKTVEEFHFPARYLYGHITLVSYLGQEEQRFIDRCKTVLREYAPFSVVYSCIEQLLPTPSIVASPSKSQQLISIQKTLAAIAPSDLDKWSSKELWHPHTTLFYHTEADLCKIAEKMQARFAPFSAEISRIEFSRVTDHGYEILDFIDL